MEKVCLYICSTYYHVYIAILKTWKTGMAADIIICDNILEYEKLAKRLIASNIFRNVIMYSTLGITERKCGKFEYWLNVHRKTKRKIKEHLNIDLNQYNTVFIFYDGIELGAYLYDSRRNYILLEDAKDFFKIIADTASSYMIKEPKIKRWIRKILNYGYFPMGQNRYCKAIEVNDIEDIVIPKKKVTICKKEPLQSELTFRQKDILLEVFNLKNSLKEILTGNAVLLLTQPFYEDGYMKSQEEQKNFYKYLIANIKKKYTVIVKPHPRDEIDYEIDDANVNIINGDFPIELLNYSGLFFQYAVTISSTSIWGLTCANETILLGIDFLNRYKKEYGYEKGIN